MCNLDGGGFDMLSLVVCMQDVFSSLQGDLTNIPHVHVNVVSCHTRLQENNIISFSRVCLWGSC